MIFGIKTIETFQWISNRRISSAWEELVPYKSVYSISNIKKSWKWLSRKVDWPILKIWIYFSSIKIHCHIRGWNLSPIYFRMDFRVIKSLPELLEFAEVFPCTRRQNESEKDRGQSKYTLGSRWIRWPCKRALCRLSTRWNIRFSRSQRWSHAPIQLLFLLLGQIRAREHI